MNERRIKMIFLSVLGAVLLTTPASAQKPACDANHITNQCEFFKKRKDKPFIELPGQNGVKFRNPLAPFRDSGGGLILNPQAPAGGFVGYGVGGGMGNGALDPAAAEQMRAAHDQMMAHQASIIDALKSAPVSTRFKMAYTQESLNITERPQLNVPWPPNDIYAPTKSVAVADVENYLKKNLSKSAYSQLRGKVKAITDPLQKQKMAFEAEQDRATQVEMEAKKKADAEELVSAQQKEKRKERIKELYKTTKELVVAAIERGRKRDQLSEDEKLLIRKIETIEMTPFDEENETSRKRCKAHVENAFYNALTHQFILCPSMVMNSDAQLVTVIAHELAHSIDPCNARMPLFEVDTIKVKSMLETAKLSHDDKEYLEQLQNEKVKYVNIDLGLMSQEGGEFLLRSGIIKRQGKDLTAYPFEKEQTCLESKYKTLKSTESDVRFTVETLTKLAASVGKKQLADFQPSIDRYEKAAKKYPQCLPTMGLETQMKEAMSDVIAAAVGEKFIMDNPFKNEEEKVAAFMFARETCDPHIVSRPALLKPRSPAEMQEVFSSPLLKVGHPESDARTQQILLNMPGMAKLLDCKRTVPACIDHLSFANRTPSKNSTNGVTSGAGAVR